MQVHLPERPVKGHKGTFGTVAIFGGSLGPDKVMLGGPALSAQAAIRTGVGLITFIGDQELLTHLIEMVPQAIGLASKADFSKEADKWKSIIIGPGLGVNKHNISLINNLLSLNKPTVIDADGLNILASYPQLLDSIHNKCVLTPHPLEFKRLANAMRVDNAKDMAAKLGCTVVLKSSTTEIVGSKNRWKGKYDNPVLATGGTGDVLSGLIGGLLAQYFPNLSPFECAVVGVEIHAKAAEKWREKHGSGGLILEELLELVPAVMDGFRQS